MENNKKTSFRTFLPRQKIHSRENEVFRPCVSFFFVYVCVCQKQKKRRGENWIEEQRNRRGGPQKKDANKKTIALFFFPLPLIFFFSYQDFPKQPAKSYTTHRSTCPRWMKRNHTKKNKKKWCGVFLWLYVLITGVGGPKFGSPPRGVHTRIFLPLALWVNNALWATRTKKKINNK